MRKGLKVLGSLPRVPGLSPQAFKDAIEKKAGVLVDVRNMLAFGGGHIAGALNIAGTPILSIWAGWLLDSEKPILLVLEEDDDLERILRLFVQNWIHKIRRLFDRRNESVACSGVSAGKHRADERARVE